MTRIHLRPVNVATEITRVVDSLNCSGCGLCAQFEGVTMQLENGFMRPVVDPQGAARTNADDLRHFRACCPGIRVQAQRGAGAHWDPDFGPVLGAWQAHAVDETIRHEGSSGGALTAITSWLLESGRACRVIGATKDREDPSRTRSVSVQAAPQVRALAGSRYAPTANAAVSEAVSTGTAFVGKPCEAQAVRRLSQERGQRPTIISFFCAGTPDQRATDKLLDELFTGTGADRTRPLCDMRYRGHGWPGEFTAVAADGTTVTTSYSESWGSALGPTVQWRCRVCPDGVGEYSDITASDFWRATPDGYPDFTEGAGVSALLARTAHGLQIIQEAVRAGVIAVAPLDLDDLRAVQPYQHERRDHLVSRRTAARVMGLRTPRMQGFGIWWRALRRPRDSWRQFRGSLSRLRHKFQLDWPWRRLLSALPWGPQGADRETVEEPR
ncbi:Coenzyme F420 hydrogenase/dehydrogenase, beta subunit C-terminal domain [Actinomyces qiguomingii]|uniref:Coenzyme F420 hydrogenase/dehydrogenase, beta subunit C-terminal domain n=1 Tax=Actinomyces qiguomingii TaxID=2057800 RepID=UPI000CA00734|nr:Coenzyme F420 hydrogenase/dehydrogenase, beta subunit C-terminal domain [Actinomyces qiguomingii]